MGKYMSVSGRNRMGTFYLYRERETTKTFLGLAFVCVLFILWLSSLNVVYLWFLKSYVKIVILYELILKALNYICTQPTKEAK